MDESSFITRALYYTPYGVLSNITTDKMIPAFLICLERLRGNECATKQNNLFEIFPHNKTSVFPAVDAAEIDLNTDTRISTFAKYHITNDIDTDFMHTAKLSAVGCSLSHIQLWEKCVSLNQPILVLEDDVRLDADFMHEAVANIPNVDFASIVYLPFADRSLCEDGWCNILPRSGFGGTQMYYITPRGASILLEQALPVVSQIDVYIGYVSNTRIDFISVFYEKQFFSQYEFWSEFHKSTIGHKIEIKKFLPESNMFYISWAVIIMMCFLFMFKTCHHTVTISYTEKHKV